MEQPATDPPKKKRRPRRKPGEAPRPLGAPRKDGLPPVQRKALAAAAPDALRRVPEPASDLAQHVRELAGDGLIVEDIAALVRCNEEDLEKGGSLFEDVQIGRALGSLHLCRELKKRAIGGHPILTIYATKALAGLSDTGRKKPAKSGEQDLTKITLRVVDAITQRGKPRPIRARSRSGQRGEKAEGGSSEGGNAAAAPERAGSRDTGVGETAPRDSSV